MARSLVCDICRKPTKRIVGKLFFAPISRGQSKKSAHNNYSLHLDVGACCAEKLEKGFSWTKRRSAAQYHSDRKNGGT
jgi:hypothetical protein